MSLTEKNLKYRRRYEIHTDSMVLFIIANDDEDRLRSYAIGTLLPAEFARQSLKHGGRNSLSALYEGVFCDLRLHLFSTPGKYRRWVGEEGLLVEAWGLRTIMIMNHLDFEGDVNADAESPAGPSDPTVS